MENKTAVEWLYETLWKQNDYSLPSAILEQAKKMEKQQMWAYVEINYVNGVNSLAFHKAEFEQYYNETFNK